MSDSGRSAGLISRTEWALSADVGCGSRLRVKGMVDRRREGRVLLCAIAVAGCVVGCALVGLFGLFTELRSVLQLLNGRLMSLKGGLDNLGCFLLVAGNFLKFNSILLLLLQQLLVHLARLLRLAYELLNDLFTLLKLSGESRVQLGCLLRMGGETRLLSRKGNSLIHLAL